MSLPRIVRTTIATVLIFSVLVFFYWHSIRPERLKAFELSNRRQEVQDAFQHAWTGYETYCKGRDTLHPVSNTCDDDFAGWSATAIDALSTAIIMGKGDTVRDILGIIDALDFTEVKAGKYIQLFELNIRHFGGMLSAWDLLNGPFKGMVKDQTLMEALYNRMVRLGDILSCAFDTPSGVPRNWVDPIACTSDDGTSNAVAGVGTLVLEFTRLSDITGNQKYADLVRKPEEYLLNPQPRLGQAVSRVARFILKYSRRPISR